MKIYHLLLVLVWSTLVLSSCDEFLDVNENVNAPTDVPVSAILPASIERTSYAQFLLARQGNIVTQHIANVGSYPERLGSSGAWSTIYLNAIDDAKNIQEKAGTQSPYYVGVAKVLEAINLGALTDCWEDVPYSEAFKGTGELTPKYDSQQELYNQIQRLLDEAITALSADESLLNPGSDDLIFGGDIDKWIKTAHTLKARYMMHLSNKGMDANAILGELDQGIASNGDNFQLMYSAEHKNYWHDIALSNRTGNLSITQGDYLIEQMKNIVSGGDPRLPLITQVPNDSIGGLNGKTVEADDEYNTDFTLTTWHSREDAPNVMVSFAEAKFLEAEAALSAGDKARAYQAYLDGIAAHMSMMEVDQADMDAYLADSLIAVGADNIDLSHIMLQKYFATYLTTEAWVDMRRHHYDPAIFPGFVPGDPYGLGVLQRMDYPQSEFDRNGNNASAAKKDPDAVMWRDQ